MDEPIVGTRAHGNFDETATTVLTRRHLIIAAAAATGTGAWWARSRSSSDAIAVATPDSGVAGTAPIGAQATQPAALPATAVAPATTAEPALFAPLERSLQSGLAGPDVEMLQQRLTELPFDPGPIDGIFGGMTKRAVWAYEKLVLGTSREAMQGTVSPELWERMNDAHGVTPRRTPGGTHLEVYLPEQVAVLFENGAASVISHVSSGEGIRWCDEVLVDNDDGTTEPKGICGIAMTPGGVYSFNRKVEGWRNAKLGRLYKPVYFNYGIAIHGAGNVPERPASRGCIRYPMHIADYIQDMVSIGDAVYVFDGVEEPETYGAQSMIFDFPDPDWVPPTTTTTTTTVPPTTTTTTIPAPATTTPATTTPTVAPTTLAPTTVAPNSVPPTTVVPSTTIAPAPATTVVAIVGG